MSLNTVTHKILNEKLVYNSQETADLLGISYYSVLRLVKRGLLHPLGGLRHKLFPGKEIQRYLDETLVQVDL